MLPSKVGADIDSFRTIARAALAVSAKDAHPDAPILLPGWHITEAFLNSRSGLPEFFGITAARDAPESGDLLVFRAAEDGVLPLADVSLRTVPCTLTPQPIPLGRIADGVLEAYASGFGGVPMRDAVWDAARRLRPGRSLLVGGHGLGAAVSTLALADLLANHLIRPARIVHVTFGSPHPGDAAFARAFSTLLGPTNASWRVENTTDHATVMAQLVPETHGHAHVGVALTFTTQSHDPIINHALARSYLPVLEHAPDLLCAAPTPGVVAPLDQGAG
jgi:hypothetical protein